MERLIIILIICSNYAEPQKNRMVPGVTRKISQRHNSMVNWDNFVEMRSIDCIKYFDILNLLIFFAGLCLK